MARCKDCVHYEACSAFSKIINSAREVEKGCEYFKDRTKYVEVVRCKDCKHFNMRRMQCENDEISTDNEGGADYSINFYLDDFCSYGERRTNEPEEPV